LARCDTIYRFFGTGAFTFGPPCMCVCTPRLEFAARFFLVPLGRMQLSRPHPARFNVIWIHKLSLRRAELSRCLMRQI